MALCSTWKYSGSQSSYCQSGAQKLGLGCMMQHVAHPGFVSAMFLLPQAKPESLGLGKRCLSDSTGSCPSQREVCCQVRSLGPG